MSLYFLLNWRLDRLDDFDFMKVWENRYLKHMRWIILVLFILYVGITIGIGTLFGEVNFLFGLLMMGLTGLVLGYFMIVDFLKFLAKHNGRYFQVKMTGQSNTVDYVDVIE